jgi:hypothetical protein
LHVGLAVALPSGVLTATQLRPRLLLAALPLLVLGGMALDRVLMTRHQHLAPHRYFSAFAMLHRATCEQSADYQTFQVGVARRDRWGNRYTFECNPRGFTIVSSDGTRSDR